MFVFGGCTADYRGESYPRVVPASQIRQHDTVPDGYRIIGDVFEESESVVDGNSLSEYALWCQVDRRLLRRMKRSAAENGGELLIGFECVHQEEEDQSPIHDDPDTNRIETELTCSTACYADVARAYAHDS